MSFTGTQKLPINILCPNFLVSDPSHSSALTFIRTVLVTDFVYHGHLVHQMCAKAQMFSTKQFLYWCFRITVFDSKRSWKLPYV